MNIDPKQRVIRFAELHGQRLIVRRTVKSRNKGEKSYIKEVLLTVPDDDAPICLFARTRQQPNPNWVKIWAKAIETLGPVESFEVPLNR